MSIKGTLLSKALGFIGGKLQGNTKRIIGLVGIVLAVLLGVIGLMFPELGLPIIDAEQILGFINELTNGATPVPTVEP